MRTLKRSFQILVVAALLALPVAAISAQTGTTVDGYVWDGASDWPGVTQIIVAPEELPQTGNSGGIYVPPNLPAPGETELTIGEAALASLAETEPGDIWLSSNPTTSEPAPSMLPETGSSRIPEPAIKEWRFDGYTLVPDWAAPTAPEAMPQTGSNKIAEPAIREWRFDGYTLVPDWDETAEPEAMPETGRVEQPDVASEPPLALPVTGSTEQAGATISGFVWDGMAYVPDGVSEPPLALPVTGSGDEAAATIVGFVWDGGTYVPDVAGSAAP